MKNLPSFLAASYDEARELMVRGLDADRYTGAARYFGSDARGDIFLGGVAPNGMVPRFDSWILVGTDGNARFISETEEVFWTNPAKVIQCGERSLYLHVLESLADWWTNAGPHMTFLPLPKRVRQSWLDEQSARANTRMGYIGA